MEFLSALGTTFQKRVLYTSQQGDHLPPLGSANFKTDNDVPILEQFFFFF